MSAEPRFRIRVNCGGCQPAYVELAGGRGVYTVNDARRAYAASRPPIEATLQSARRYLDPKVYQLVIEEVE